jgi:hypothetical protein
LSPHFCIEKSPVKAIEKYLSHSEQRKEILLYFKETRHAQKPIHSLLNWYLGQFHGRKADGA